MEVFYAVHDNGLTYMLKGCQYTVSTEHMNYSKILQCLKDKQYDNLKELTDIAGTINKNGSYLSGKISVENGEVFYIDTRNRKKVKLHGALVDRIMNCLGQKGREKFATGLINLLENIQKNPIKDISGELYEWFLSGKNPITVDGCILAYKKVRNDFKDIYSGTMDNSPGKIVKMKQSDVDTDRHNKCSVGLHFASLSYLKHYGNTSESRIMIVKVNPRHIFAIPTDYSCQKGRASEYLVVGEYVNDNRERIEAFKDSFIDEDNVKEAAPDVVIHKNSLRPSVKVMGENMGYVKNEKVQIDSNGNVVLWDDNPAPGISERSIKTKTVYAKVRAIVTGK